VTSDDALPIPGPANALLWEVVASIERMDEAALADPPITTASSGMLTMVLAEPGITVTEISRRSSKAKQTISQMATRPEKLELIERGVGFGQTAVGRELAEQGVTRGARSRLGSASCSAPTATGRPGNF
jgi:hypothetical protein